MSEVICIWSRSRNFLKDSSTLQDQAFSTIWSSLWENWSDLHENFIINVSLDKKVPITCKCLNCVDPDSSSWLDSPLQRSALSECSCVMFWATSRSLVSFLTICTNLIALTNKFLHKVTEHTKHKMDNKITYVYFHAIHSHYYKAYDTNLYAM